MFVDLHWPLNASRRLSASAELLVYISTDQANLVSPRKYGSGAWDGIVTGGWMVRNYYASVVLYLLKYGMMFGSRIWMLWLDVNHVMINSNRFDLWPNTPHRVSPLVQLFTVTVPEFLPCDAMRKRITGHRPASIHHTRLLYRKGKRYSFAAWYPITLVFEPVRRYTVPRGTASVMAWNTWA